MGKVQCKTAITENDLINIIEKKIKSKNLTIDIKIQNEYLSIIEQSHNKPNVQSFPLKLQKNDKHKEKKSIEVFKKWYKMAYISDTQETQNTHSFYSKSLYKFPSNNLICPSTEKVIKHNQDFADKIEVIPNKKNYIFHRNQSNACLNDFNRNRKMNDSLTSSKFGTKRKNSNKNVPLNENKSLFNHVKLNIINQTELGLREYVNENRSKFVNRLLKGPSELFRWISWVISIGIPEERNNDIYNNLLKSSISSQIDNQIIKDLHRTLSEDNYFLLENTKNILYRLLKGFAIYDAEVSYCQGMNFIAGFLLIVSDFNEIDSFYMLLSLFTKDFSNNFGIRGFFLNGFPLLKYYVYQFDHIFKKKLPNLKKHFDKLEVPNELWISKWFQTLFTICMPIDLIVRIWDCIIFKGLYFLHNFTLALLISLEKDFMDCTDICDVAEIFNRMNPYLEGKKSRKKIIFNIEELIDNALNINVSWTLLNKLKGKYEKIFKFDLSIYQNFADEINNSASNSYQINDQSCSEFSVLDSFSNCFKTIQNDNPSDQIYESNLFKNDNNNKSTNINSHSYKNDNKEEQEEEYVSENEEENVIDNSICSEFDLFDKTKIENKMKNYIMNTKIINRNSHKIKSQKKAK